MTNKSHSTLYIGVTNNIIKRVYEHKNKLTEGFSARYNLSKLVFAESARNAIDAIAREKQIKKWSRAKKEWLIK